MPKPPLIFTLTVLLLIGCAQPQTTSDSNNSSNSTACSVTTRGQFLDDAASNLLTTFSMLLAFFGFFSALYLSRGWTPVTHIFFKVLVVTIFLSLASTGVSEVVLLSGSSLQTVPILSTPLALALQVVVSVMILGAAFSAFLVLQWRA